MMVTAVALKLVLPNIHGETSAGVGVEGYGLDAVAICGSCW